MFKLQKSSNQKLGGAFNFSRNNIALKTIFLACTLFLLVLFPQKANAATFTPANSVAFIADIAAAQNGDIINLAPATTYNVGPATLSITQDIIINGNNATIETSSAAGNHGTTGAINIAGNVTLNDLKIKGTADYDYLLQLVGVGGKSQKLNNVTFDGVSAGAGKRVVVNLFQHTNGVVMNKVVILATCEPRSAGYGAMQLNGSANNVFTDVEIYTSQTAIIYNANTTNGQNKTSSINFTNAPKIPNAVTPIFSADQASSPIVVTGIEYVLKTIFPAPAPQVYSELGFTSIFNIVKLNKVFVSTDSIYHSKNPSTYYVFDKYFATMINNADLNAKATEIRIVSETGTNVIKSFSASKKAIYHAVVENYSEGKNGTFAIYLQYNGLDFNLPAGSEVRGFDFTGTKFTREYFSDKNIIASAIYNKFDIVAQPEPAPEYFVDQEVSIIGYTPAKVSSGFPAVKKDQEQKQKPITKEEQANQQAKQENEQVKETPSKPEQFVRTNLKINNQKAYAALSKTESKIYKSSDEKSKDFLKISKDSPVVILGASIKDKNNVVWRKVALKNGETGYIKESQLQQKTKTSVLQAYLYNDTKIGTPTADLKIYDKVGGEQVGVASKNVSIVITGETNGYYTICFGTKKGFVPKMKVSIDKVQPEEPKK